VLKKKVILHIHPAYFLVFLNSFRRVKKSFFFSLLNKIDTFIVLTDGMKRDLQVNFPRQSIHVLSNPVHLERMANKYGIVRSKNRLLYLGWYNRMKGVYDLVDAAGMLVEQGYNFQLDFYGTKETSELREYVKSKRLAQVISVNGWADDEETLKALYGSALLILPSYTEGIPNVILEAMATRTPIVSTHVGGLKEILTDGQNAVIAAPGNPADLSRKIAYLLDHEESRTILAECAYREIKMKYNLPVIKEQFEQIVLDVESRAAKIS
jgi:glycosyltransferase involved in cell wall biosynthesis